MRSCFSRCLLGLSATTGWLGAASCHLLADFDDFDFQRSPCSQDSDCSPPRSSDPCLVAECVNGGCSPAVAEGAPCSAGGGHVCDSTGRCVECRNDSECTFGTCTDGTCECNDGIRNGGETDIDCGGSDCASCGAMNQCTLNSDCLGGICISMQCEGCGDVEWAQWTPGDGEWTVRSTTARDERTGLTWARTAALNEMSWSDALVFCQANPPDEGSWRLPTRIELSSIIDYERSSPPVVDTNIFPNISAAAFWTATSNAGDDAQAWYTSLSAGNIDLDVKTRLLHVLCVR